MAEIVVGPIGRSTIFHNNFIWNDGFIISSMQITGILFHLAVFTLNNYLIKRRKENCGGNCRRPYRAADNLPWNDGFIISSIQINKAYNIHFS